MKRTVKDTEITAKVGALLDMSSTQVGDVTHQFFDEVMRHLLDGNEVYIPGFGIFKVSERKGKRQNITRLNKSSNYKGDSVGETLVEVKKKFYVSFRRAKAFQARFSARYGKNKVQHEDLLREK